MKLNFKIWHCILSLWVIILLLSYERLYELLVLLGAFIRLIVTDFNLAVSYFNLQLADHLFGAVVFILLPFAILIIRKNKESVINNKIFISAFLFIILLYAFLFTPLITERNPDFYSDIAVTKLLPPFSSVEEIRLLDDDAYSYAREDKFSVIKKQIIQQPFDDRVIFCDSAFVSAGKISYHQSGYTESVLTEQVEKKNDKYSTTRIFIFGTDEYGRDILTRLIYGARLSLFIGFCSVIFSFILGMSFGFFAGFKSGWIDLVLNRLTDLFLAFPVIFLIIFIIALFGNNIISVVVVLGLSGWMSLFKLVKTEVSLIRKKDYFISATLLGVSTFMLMKKEVFPIILAPVIVNVIFQFGNVVLAESALSYLGLGLGNEYPSIGSMIQSGQDYISRSWWMIILPGLLLIITLLTINDLGKKIKVFYNPRVKYD
ncbi:MAG: ABC transporter permease [Ignavibacteriaceae bacterium]